MPLGKHNPLTQASNLSQNTTDFLTRCQHVLHWFHYVWEGAPVKRRKIQEDATCQTLPRTEQFPIVPSWSQSSFSHSQQLQSGTFLQITHDWLKSIVDSKNMSLCGHSSANGWNLKRNTPVNQSFSHLHPREKFLFKTKTASSEMVCMVKQITGNYRDWDFLFHSSEINITLPFFMANFFKQVRPGHHRWFRA